MATEKALIVLQENTGKLSLDEDLPADVQHQVRTIVDGLAETFEDIKTTLQANGKYKVVHLLTDNACSRSNLLHCLVDESTKGRTIDLIVLGHGDKEFLRLKKKPSLIGGSNRNNIRTLLPEAKALGASKLNLRLVYMCNCHGSSVNDDWLAIGAKVAVGPKDVNSLPEPTTTFFVHNWLRGQQAARAAKDAYSAATPFFLPIFPPTAKPTYKTVTVSYPCPTVADPFRTRKQKVKVPDGVSWREHEAFRRSELVVSGDGSTKF